MISVRGREVCLEVLAQEVGDDFTHYELLSMEQIQSLYQTGIENEEFV
jgi:hypothetical protein